MNTEHKSERVLARHVIKDSKDYGLAIVEISKDGNSYSITPFEEETASTIYYNGTVTIEEIDYKYYLVFS